MSMRLYEVDHPTSDYDEIGDAVIFATDEEDARTLFREECNPRPGVLEVVDITDRIGVRGVLHSQFNAG